MEKISEMPTERTAGNLVLYFRQMVGMSQLDLEIEVGVSSGTISRIEKGKANPMKETLQKIAEALNLNNHQKSILLGAYSEYPSQLEVSNALAEVESYFSDPSVFAYLIDEWGIVYKASTGAKMTLELDDKTTAKGIGKNIIEIILDPQFNISTSIEPDSLVKTLANEIARIREEVGLEILQKALGEDAAPPEALISAMQLSQSITSTDLMSPDSRIISFKDGVKFRFTRERLKNNHRFEIIELVKIN